MRSGAVLINWSVRYEAVETLVQSGAGLQDPIQHSMRTRSLLAAALAMIGLSMAVQVLAQSIQLSAEQQRLLNQLPASQRQQALDALRQMQGGSQPQTVGQPITEETAATPGETLPPEAMDLILGPQRAGPNSQLIIDLTPSEELSAMDLRDLARDPLLSRLQGSHSYVLDDDGVLSLFGVVSVPLLGLTEDDVVRRLAAEELLWPFDIDARLLQMQAVGSDAIEPFGYDILESDDGSLDPSTTGPVPPDYVLGPGDTVRVQFFGNVNGIYEFDVTRDGILNLPEIGPVNVAGLPFSEFRADVSRRVQEMLIGTQVSITMGQLRNIRVFVLGDVNRPGSYVISSLATISSALYRSGGISRIGSLRDVQLKRNGDIVARLDLYDLFLRGDNSDDSRLQPGDVIFVPAVGTQVGISGAVIRPAVYEVRGPTSLADLVRMAGGLLPDAYPTETRIERIAAGEVRTVVSVDAAGSTGAGTSLQAGDMVRIPQVLPELEDVVTLVGHVHRPGPYQWHPGMRLNNILGSALALRPGGDLEYVLVRREDPVNRSISVLSANLLAALASPSSSQNILLQPRDTVHVFNLALGRQQIIEPILEELQLQSGTGNPYREASISGQVKAPGIYPLEPGMRVSDLVRAGGGLAEEAYTLNAEVARYEVIGDEYRNVNVFDVNLAAVLRGDEAADVLLGEHDNLRISRVPDWESLLTVELEGEVTFPGSYRIGRGETLSHVIQRAGGLTDDAFADGAVFLRQDLRRREQEQIEILARRLQADLTSMTLEQSETRNPDSIETGRSLLAQLRETQAVGRLVIDLSSIVAGGSRALDLDVELRDGDRLLVPTRSQSVTVIGETQQNTSHLYREELSRDDYIELSGGLTRRADRKLIYVVRANGAVVVESESRWFGRRVRSSIEPGDTIVVPLETDRIRPLTLWSSVTQILYQAAIAVAAIDTFNR